MIKAMKKTRVMGWGHFRQEESEIKPLKNVTLKVNVNNKRNQVSQRWRVLPVPGRGRNRVKRSWRRNREGQGGYDSRGQEADGTLLTTMREVKSPWSISGQQLTQSICVSWGPLYLVSGRHSTGGGQKQSRKTSKKYNSLYKRGQCLKWEWTNSGNVLESRVISRLFLGLIYINYNYTQYMT